MCSAHRLPAARGSGRQPRQPLPTAPAARAERVWQQLQRDVRVVLPGLRFVRQLALRSGSIHALASRPRALTAGRRAPGRRRAVLGGGLGAAGRGAGLRSAGPIRRLLGRRLPSPHSGARHRAAAQQASRSGPYHPACSVLLLCKFKGWPQRAALSGSPGNRIQATASRTRPQPPIRLPPPCRPGARLPSGIGGSRGSPGLACAGQKRKRA